MRVKQFELFREDIRDLMELTVAKMDNYLIAARPCINKLEVSSVSCAFRECGSRF